MLRLCLILGVVVLVQLCSSASVPAARYRREAAPVQARYRRFAGGPRVNDNGHYIRRGRPAAQGRSKDVPDNENNGSRHPAPQPPVYYYEPVYYSPPDMDCSCQHHDCGPHEFENGDCGNDEKLCCKYE